MDSTLQIDQYSNQERIEKLVSTFEREFDGKKPEAVIRVPGRVNLIGEHIDYCGYGVHPMAIEQDILVAVAYSNDSDAPNAITVANVDKEKYPEPFFSSDLLNNNDLELVDGQAPTWWNYFLCGVKGVVGELLQNTRQHQNENGEQKNCGYIALMDGKIPPSAGLSSSSAVVVSAAVCTVWAYKIKVERDELASICARSERFIGTQGGGMDQAIELLAKQGTAKLIEFNPLRATDVTLPKGATFVIANSLAQVNKADSSGGSKYNVRVAECRIATKILAKKLGLESWKDVSNFGPLQKETGKNLSEMLALVESTLHREAYSKSEICSLLDLSNEDELFDLCKISDHVKNYQTFELYKRAIHVFGEAKRVYDFKSVCDENQAQAKVGEEGKTNFVGGGNPLARLGKLMFASHDSCDKMYDCSHPQLNTLVELSRKHGALGARLTGAGWGGCIVALVPQSDLKSYIDGIKKDYYSSLNSIQAKEDCLDNVIFPTQPGAGAQIYTV